MATLARSRTGAPRPTPTATGMIRDLQGLEDREFDLVVVGGGIYGVCAAWDAALRGLSVALLERGDFGHATSANSLKLVHGGFRYLQHADVPRIRHSVHERRVLMCIAPHLVHPLPFLVPAYGHGLRGKEILTVALSLYNLIAFDRNRGVTDSQRRIPFGELLSPARCLELFPELEARALTGGVVFYDGQMHAPPRLLLAYLRSAVEAGARAANYAEVTGLLRQGDRVVGVRVKDLAGGDTLRIRGKVVLNAAGPWVPDLLARVPGSRPKAPLRFSKDLYLVVRRRFSPRYALAVPSHERDPNALVSRGTRHLFLIPWRGHTLIGSSHVAYRGSADDFTVTEQDIEGFLAEVNRGYPGARLGRDEVTFVYSGLVPMEGDAAGSFGLKLARRHQIIDHERADGVPGLISVAGVRFTTSRIVAEHAVDLVLRKLGRPARNSSTASTPLAGGTIEDFDAFLRTHARERPDGMSEAVMSHLLHCYGTLHAEVLRLIEHDARLNETLGDSDVLKAEVVHAVRSEMAQTLSDVVFRRTDLATAGHPGEPALTACAALLGEELGWDETRVARELDHVRSAFP